MIDFVSFSPEWLAEKRKKYGKDPSIIESMIHALYLLEQLQLSGLTFVFKGGTSLVLLLERPQRFSVDIDILVNPLMTREKLETHLQTLLHSGIFKRMQLDERRSYKAGIPKAHYKFSYLSNVSTKTKAGEVLQKPEREILLDVVFAEYPYPVLIEKSISTEWLVHSEKAVWVRMPDVNSLTGDKLTAFAPNTTGIPYKADKEKEILKQLFDIGCLFHLLDDLTIFKKAFHETAKTELTYGSDRPVESVEHILLDILATSMLIAKRDRQETPSDKEKMHELQVGIRQFSHFVFEGNFRIEEAQVAAAKAAYLAAIVLTDYTGKLEHFDATIARQAYQIKHPDYVFLNKRLKFSARGEALFYWYKTVAVLHADA